MPCRYTGFGIASTLIGAQGPQEPHNYIWPWLKTSYGLIDVATGPKALDGNLSKTLDSFLKAEHPKGFKLIKVTPLQIGDIPLIKTVSENNTGFKIIRFYFLSPSGLLAFLHLHSWSDQSALEGIVSSIKRTEQDAAANP